MIKDFDTFEANLVMSTLSPEDIEFEVQQSRSAVQKSLQQNLTTDDVVLDKTNADCDADRGEAINAGSTASDMFADKNPISHEDDRLNNGLAIAKKRNRSLASGSDLFESSISKRPSLDIVLRTNNQRTSNDLRRDTHIPSANNQTENRAAQPPVMPILDLESQNVDVVFQEESNLHSPNGSPHFNRDVESMDVDVVRNDHRPRARNLLEICYSGNTPTDGWSLGGRILLEGSDSEE